jgi:carboxyl-terminal processing protease
MLPLDDPQSSAHADAAASDATPSNPPTAPGPTGLLDQPVTQAVTPAGGSSRERRGSWPFALAIALVAVLGGGALFLSGYSVGQQQAREPGTAAEDQAAFQPFWDVYDAIRNRYPLGPVDKQTLVEGAIRGLVDSVGDPYSSYLSPEDFRGTLDDISGQFEGIGAEIGSVDSNGNTSDCATFGPDCHLVVIAPIEGSPAEAAGLRPGDVIDKVDGSTLDGLTPDQARDRVRGTAGTTVTLHIKRYEAPPSGSGASPSPGPSPTAKPAASPGASGGPIATPFPRKLLEEFDVTLTRAKVQRKEVTARELAGGSVGYIRLSGFSDAGADEVEAALKADVGKGIKGPVFWEEDAKGNFTQTDAQSGGIATDPSIKLVVLMDRGTASASEIVAGAIQDRDRGQLVGETSFGKGTVQEWLDLGQTGGVKLTVYKWLTPDKRWIHKVGLTPDVPVKVPADTPPGSDPVLDRALEILGGTGAVPFRLLAG